MALNRACIGKAYPSVTAEVTRAAIENYARACNDDNPRYFDQTAGIIAPPLFAVTVTWIALIGALTDPVLRADLLRLLHRAQDMEFFRPIRPGDVINSNARIVAIETVAGGETIALELDAKDDRGEAVSKAVFAAFIRGRRDNDRAMEGKKAESIEQRGEPWLTVSQKIDRDQTFRYAEASGDRNPIHVDDKVAKMAGLPGVIVHGLCTMAFTSKVMIDTLCDGDPLRLRRLAVRFSRPVFPGDQISTRVWPSSAEEHRVFTYETCTPEGLIVIRDGVAEISPHHSGRGLAAR
ncbi:MAG: MaoC/PaaZ C-terminal domain-containing protein [Candidatus Binataceae bacterium]